MGDRSITSFQFPATHYRIHRDVIAALIGRAVTVTEVAGSAIVTIPECEGGGFDLANALETIAIPFTSWWEAGIAFDCGATCSIPGVGSETVALRVFNATRPPVVVPPADAGADVLASVQRFIALRHCFNTLVAASAAPERHAEHHGPG